MIAITFVTFLGLFVAVGMYSSRQQQSTTTDYLLASRQVSPWLTALSAMASGQSGLLFTGQIGFAYEVGLSSLWLTVGWAIGDYLAWLLVFKRLRQVSETVAAETVPALLGRGRDRGCQPQPAVIIFAAIVTVIFLGTYAGAQLVAGSKALQATFGWDPAVGAVAGAIVVAIYCFSGGIRASIWTDAVQGVVMSGSLLLLLGTAIVACGGFGAFWQQLAALDPDLLSLSPTNLPWGFLPFFLGWVAAGFGVIGQPHILVRAMAIDSAENVGLARNIKAIGGLTNSLMAIGIGMGARVLLPALLTEGDPELALPSLALELLPAALVGLMLAGVFSATISTADSQILSCSAALTQDLLPAKARSYRLAKLGTLSVTMLTLSVALVGNDSVFTVVTFSWSMLASSLGPLLVVRLFGRPITAVCALSIAIAGIAAALSWNLVFQLSGALYEVLPGMAAGMLVYYGDRLLSHRSQPERS